MLAMATFSTRLEHPGLERYQSTTVSQAQMPFSQIDDDTMVSVCVCVRSNMVWPWIKRIFTRGMCAASTVFVYI